MKILAAIDFSPATSKVLDVARQHSSLAAASLYLVHVVDPNPAFVGYEAGPQTVRDQMAKRFRHEHEECQKFAAEMREKGINATALVVQGATSETILEEANRLGADLIVVGSHGHSAMYQMLVGSVSEGVIRGAKCPVIVVPAHAKS